MTVSSMTGFGSARLDTPAGRLSLDVRSVNARFLDLSFRMPDEFRFLEPALRERVHKVLHRGKVEVRLALQAAVDQGSTQISDQALAQLVATLAHLRQVLPDLPPPTLSDVLRWPGMVTQTELTSEQWQAAASTLMDQALAEFRASRAREGQRLASAMAERVAFIRTQLSEASEHIPAALEAHRQKLADRISQALSVGELPVDQDQLLERVRQELTLHGLRTDVAEEITRLQAHLNELEQVLDKGGQSGKRLDFLMQELHREANTLGSKSPTLELSNIAMNLKLAIEQIREQVQNLE